MLGACASPSTPTPVPARVPVAPDPPKITCPAAQTAQSVDGTPTPVTFTAAVVNGQTPVTTICTPSAGSPFSVGQKTVVCNATDALQRSDSCSFVVTVLAPPKLTTTSFLSFGDSITAGEDGQNSTAPTQTLMSARFHPSVLFPSGLRYPQELQALLAGRYKTQAPTVDNQGSPGEAASDPATIKRFTALTATRRYSVALIMEGTNDLYDRDDRIFPFAIDALRSMIRDAKGRGIRPYLATIPPMNPSACVPVCRGLPWSLVSGFNDGVRTLATTEGVTLVDVYQGFNGNFALIGPDGLHPSADGYARIADLFFTAIKQTLETSSTSSVQTLHHAAAAP
ncbi:MAG: GDSL-like Lipase/Acylhydrolase [Acidobacteria bacterium]|nr:GDSL-like Lipase/Acylhydrolase [Acidobacteriota bacterium]